MYIVQNIKKIRKIEFFNLENQLVLEILSYKKEKWFGQRALNHKVKSSYVWSLIELFK